MKIGWFSQNLLFLKKTLWYVWFDLGFGVIWPDLTDLKKIRFTETSLIRSNNKNPNYYTVQRLVCDVYFFFTKKLNLILKYYENKLYKLGYNKCNFMKIVRFEVRFHENGSNWGSILCKNILFEANFKKMVRFEVRFLCYRCCILHCAFSLPLRLFSFLYFFINI